MSRGSSILSAGLLAVFWLLAAQVGFHYLDGYASQPGEIGDVPSCWPRESRLKFELNTLNLVVAVHPHCPCSRAGLDELERLLADCRGHVKVHVLLWQPQEASIEWQRTQRCEQAQRLPGASLYTDVGGTEAKRFGAKTSGQIFLFGETGQLLFSGGITAARGMAGDNPHSDALRQRLSGECRFAQMTPVFGCPLDSPE